MDRFRIAIIIMALLALIVIVAGARQPPTMTAPTSTALVAPMSPVADAFDSHD